MNRAQKMEQIQEGVRQILCALEVPLADRNFATTPERYAKFIAELFWSPKPTITSFQEEHDQMVILRDIEAWTLCPHHLLPVRLQICAAYTPRGEVLGASKLARLFDEINRLPLMQETATDLLCTRLFELTGGMGAAVVMKGEHLCMRMRGIKQAGSSMYTNKMMGVMKENPQARQEFLQFAALP